VSILAQVLAAAQDVNVRIVDNGDNGFDWSKVITPSATLLAALVGGLGGVVIGGKMNRSTLKTLEDERAQRESAHERDRAEREDKLDQARADRDRELELARERRAINAEKRQALGAIRYVLSELERLRIGFSTSVERAEWWPIAWKPRASQTTEQSHLLATWLRHLAWTDLALTLYWIESLARFHGSYGQPSIANRREMLETTDAIRDSVLELRREADRLSEEIGEEAAREWTDVPGDVDPVVAAQVGKETDGHGSDDDESRHGPRPEPPSESSPPGG
jgi:hypothetical protein